MSSSHAHHTRARNAVGRWRRAACLALAGCCLVVTVAPWSAVRADPPPQTGQPWQPPNRTGTPTTGRAPIVPRATSGTSVVTFDELPPQAVNGLSFKGVTFDFKISGLPSTDATFGGTGPGTLVYVQDPSLEGNSDGVLTLTFAIPTDTLQFGLARDTSAALTPAASIQLLDNSSMPIETASLNTPVGEGYSEGQFVYSGIFVKTAIISFPAATLTTRFALDNLTFTVPSTPTPIATATATATSTSTPTVTSTAGPSVTATPTVAGSPPATNTATPTVAGSPSATSTATPTVAGSPPATSTATATVAGSPPPGSTSTRTPTVSTSPGIVGGTVNVPADGTTTITFDIVLTQNGAPLTGVQVVFSAPTSGPSGTFAVVPIVGGRAAAAPRAAGALSSFGITDNTGRAISAPFTPNGIAGSYTVTATTPTGDKITFNVTNVAVAAAPTPVIPELPTPWLFGTGLLLLGWFGHSRRQT